MCRSSLQSQCFLVPFHPAVTAELAGFQILARGRPGDRSFGRSPAASLGSLLQATYPKAPEASLQGLVGPKISWVYPKWASSRVGQMGTGNFMPWTHVI